MKKDLQNREKDIHESMQQEGARLGKNTEQMHEIVEALIQFRQERAKKHAEIAQKRLDHENTQELEENLASEVRHVEGVDLRDPKLSVLTEKLLKKAEVEKALSGLGKAIENFEARLANDEPLHIPGLRSQSLDVKGKKAVY